ncbi:MAG TPA: hypothetical protein VM052_07115 [Candidatus Limnocylindrales bacterium]|nr:hypothetical protein [Candidatus Limnocylindrales bacterium]
MSRRTRGRLGAALLAYGVIGLVLMGIFFWVADSAIQRLAIVDPSAGPLAEATSALGDTANAFGGFGTSLVDAERATAQAATSARDASSTASRLADAMNLSIFGAQPLLPLVQDFRRQATDLDDMAKGLDTLSSSLRSNQGDVAKIRDDLTLLRSRLASAQTGGISVEPLRALVLLLVAWLSFPALASLVAGISLLRSARSRATRRSS